LSSAKENFLELDREVSSIMEGMDCITDLVARVET
jgi:hypothetical protein